MAAKLTVIETTPIRDIEQQVLADAVRDMDGWIARLPTESSWCWTFVNVRGDIARCVNERKK